MRTSPEVSAHLSEYERSGSSASPSAAPKDPVSTATGKFDAVTESAVRDFQDDNNRVSDGIIGPRTFAYLARLTV